tara:strand:- start:5918 stop:6496 length:579 start_codon:yes stop_codon:yes gene_type:complete
MNKISYKNELLRKSIHLSSSILSLIIYLYGKNFVIYPMIFLTISYVLLDYLRKKNDINNFYLKYFKIVSRENEIKGSLTGASYLLIGYTTTILLYDETAVIISILIVSLSDSVSAIVGRKYGYINIRNKTLEGTMSFLLCSIFIFLPFGYNYINIFILSIIITLVEFFDDILIDDNLSLPIISGFLISLILI